MVQKDSLGNAVIPDKMVISLAGQGRVSKSFTMMLEMIAQSNFSRPLYMSTTVGASNYGNLFKHFMQEGIAWRITPYTFSENNAERGVVRTICDTEKQYDNMMNKYRYGNLKQPGLYIDETTMRMCYTHRRWFANLISHLVREEKYDKALKALDKCEEEIPSYNVPHDIASSSLEMVNAYIACGKPEKAANILAQVEKKSNEYIRWYLSLDAVRFAGAYKDCYSDIYSLANIQNIYNKMAESDAPKKADYAKKSSEIEKRLEGYYDTFSAKCMAAGISFN